MKLLFYGNLAARLARDLADLYPGAAHRLGNCATADVARLLRFRADRVRAFAEQPEVAFL